MLSANTRCNPTGHFTASNGAIGKTCRSILVDLEADEAERHPADQNRRRRQIMADEEKAERELERKRRIPQDAWRLLALGPEVQVMKAAESTVHTNKGRAILQAPLPGPDGQRQGHLNCRAHSLNVLRQPGTGVLHPTHRGTLRHRQTDHQGRRRIVENPTVLPWSRDGGRTVHGGNP